MKSGIAGDAGAAEQRFGRNSIPLPVFRYKVGKGFITGLGQMLYDLCTGLIIRPTFPIDTEWGPRYLASSQLP
jgi:hypothetical protein